MLEIVLITSICYTTKVKKTLNIKFYSMPVYDEKHIIAKRWIKAFVFVFLKFLAERILVTTYNFAVVTRSRRLTSLCKTKSPFGETP